MSSEAPKMQCRYFNNGYCRYGIDCYFLHDESIKTAEFQERKRLYEELGHERKERERKEREYKEREYKERELERDRKFEREILLKQTYYACEENDIKKLMELIEDDNPIHPDCTYVACRINNLKMLRYLVKKGAPIDKNCANFVCMRDNTTTTLEFLIKKGAYICENCVCTASRRGNMEMLKLLMENKAYVSSSTMSSCCSDSKNKDDDYKISMLSYLIEKGVPVDPNCVVLASIGGNMKLIQFFVENGADINEVHTYYACERNHYEALEYLLRHGAKLGEDCKRYKCKKCASIQNKVRMQMEQEMHETLFKDTKLNENLIEMVYSKI